jgi:hypothetical protein
MALAEKHRSVIYAHFVETIGEEAAEAMLSQFPARDLDEPVTKEFVALTASELRSEIAEVRTEITVTAAELRTEIADLRGEMIGRFGDVDAELATLRGEMTTEFAKVRGEMADMGKHLAARLQITIGIATGALGVLTYLTR